MALTLSVFIKVVLGVSNFMEVVRRVGIFMKVVLSGSVMKVVPGLRVFRRWFSR
jgi:hypothetical protein